MGQGKAPKNYEKIRKLIYKNKMEKENKTIGIVDNLNNERVATLKENDTCPECNELWDSEYHMSDQCVNINEDQE